MKGKFMIIAALLGALTFGACVDNNESASVENVRNAKAEELKSIAALNNAKAQAELIAANADAALKASQAAINEAEAAIREAEARLKEAQAEWQEIQNDQERAELEALIAKYEADITYYQMIKAQYVAQMQEDALEAEKALLVAQQNLLQQERDFAAKLDEWADEDAELLHDLFTEYADAANELNKAVTGVTNTKALIAMIKANVLSAAESTAKEIAEYEEVIANAEANIATIKEMLAIFMKVHEGDIVSGEELEDMKVELYTQLATLLEESAAAMDAYKPLEKAAQDAFTAMNNVQNNYYDQTTGKNVKSLLTLVNEAQSAYTTAVEVLRAQAGLVMYDDDSHATNNKNVESWGYYTDDSVAGTNGIFNPVIDLTFAAGLNFDEEDDVFDETYEYTLYTINETNLATLVADAKKGYSEEQIAKAKKALDTATKNKTAAEAALTAAETAAATAKTAAETAAADYKTAYAAWTKYNEDFAKVEATVDAEIAELKKAYDAAVKALAAANKAKDAADAALIKNETPANKLAAAEAALAVTKAENDKALAEAAYNTAVNTRTAKISQGQLALGDKMKLYDAAIAAEKVLNKAIAAYESALNALGEAPKYNASGDFDVKAKYLTFEVTYNKKKGVLELGTVTGVNDAAAYEDSQYYEYTDAAGKTVKTYSAHYILLDAISALAEAQSEYDKKTANGEEFAAKIEKAQADLKAATAAYEAAVKAYNEAWVAAVAAFEAADAKAQEAWVIVDNAGYAVHKVRQQILAIIDAKEIFISDHAACAAEIEKLNAKIVDYEAVIEDFQGMIDAAKVALENNQVSAEAQVARLEKQLEMQELLVEVETIYAEAAKAALDAELANQSTKTEE